MAYSEESQSIPIDGIAEKLDRIKRFEGPAAEFWPAFLEGSTPCCGCLEKPDRLAARRQWIIPGRQHQRFDWQP